MILLKKKVSDDYCQIKNNSLKELFKYIAKCQMDCEFSFTNGDGNLCEGFIGVDEFEDSTLHVYNEDDDWVILIFNNNFKLHSLTFI